MTKAAKSEVVLALIIAFMFAVNAHAGVTLAAARIGAADVAGVAKFYQSAFGMHEVNRLDMPGIKEIMLNFGGTVEAAKANPNPWIVIMGRTSDDVKEVPHLVLYVTDMKTILAAVKAAGGTVEGEPRAFGEAGMIVGAMAALIFACVAIHSKGSGRSGLLFRRRACEMQPPPHKFLAQHRRQTDF